MRSDESRPFALGAESKVLDLHDLDDGVVVIGLEKVDVARLDAGLIEQIFAIERPSAAKLNGVIGKCVMPFDGAENAGMGESQLLCDVAAGHEKSFGACARHDAV